jgi:hypothetical protein
VSFALDIAGDSIGAVGLCLSLQSGSEAELNMGFVTRCIAARAGRMRRQAVVISRPTPQYWQVLELGISNLGRSFGERSLSSFHHGLAASTKGCGKRCADCDAAPCKSRNTDLARGCAGCRKCYHLRTARGGWARIGKRVHEMLHKTGQDAVIGPLQLV